MSGKKNFNFKEDPELFGHWRREAKKLGFATFSGYVRQLLIRELGDGKYHVGRSCVKRLETVGDEEN